MSFCILNDRPIILLDSEYGNASFLNQTTDVEADFLMRIRSNRCLYAAPPPYTGKGRPRKHGQKFTLNDPSTWWEATETIEVENAKLGQLRVRRWQDLHFSGSASTPMQLILVERLNPTSSQSKSKPLWLVWVGQSMPPLERIWRKYLRRFAVDHWYRFLKQRLHWTVPQLSTPHQCERWSDLMPIMTWELWLAKDLVAQYHLPWQKPIQNLTRLLGSSVDFITFTRDGYTGYGSQTPWKVRAIQTFHRNVSTINVPDNRESGNRLLAVLVK